MTSKFESPAYLRFMDFLVEKVTPEAILDFKTSEEWRQRSQHLLTKKNRGEITPEEALELQRMQQIDKLETILKALSADKLGISIESGDSSSTPAE